MARTHKKPRKHKADPLFLWVGNNQQGRRLKGEQAASSIGMVKAILRRQGIKPIRIRRKPKELFAAKKPPIKSRDIAIFSRMLATMMASGVPLTQSLQVIGEGHENSAMKEMVLAIKADVESGTNLTDSLAKFPLYFDDLYVSLIRAGEQSGALEGLLNEIANYKEKTEALKAKIKKAMVYPSAILAVAFIVTAIMMIFVIPQFEKIFDSFGAELPVLTQIVITISEFFQQYWWLILGGSIAMIVGLIEMKKRSRPLQHFFDRLALKVPVLGPVFKKGAIARFSRTFSTMFKAGVPMVEAMQSVAGATGNILYSQATMIMRDDVASGTQLNIAMKNSDLFPNIPIQMVAIGEESGELDKMLAKVADFYEAEVDDAVDNMTSLLEPFIMIILGVLIGTLVTAMYLPIFKMGMNT